MPGGPILAIDPHHPQPRHVERVAAVLEAGGLVALPTDTYYALACDLFNKKAIEKLRLVKHLDKSHQLSFVCSDIAEATRYALIEDAAYRVLRRKTPGAFTFILPATRLVPDLVQTRQKTVGIRIPDAPIAIAVVRALGRPVLVSSAATPEGEVLIDPRDIKEQLGHGLELVVDGGYQLNEPSTVVDLTSGVPVVTREGKGDASDL